VLRGLALDRHSLTAVSVGAIHFGVAPFHLGHTLVTLVR